MTQAEHPFTVFVADEHVSARVFEDAVRKSAGPLLCVLAPLGLSHIEGEPLRSLLAQCRSLNRDRRLVIATKDERTRRAASREGWDTVSTVKQLRPLLRGAVNDAAAFRTFSPVVWRETIRSRLQAIGILSLPRLRIWLLLAMSIGVFLYTFFRLLPTSEIRIWPHQELQTFTMNLYLASSGAVLPIDRSRATILPLIPLTVSIQRTLTYDQVSKRFTGTNATMDVSIINDTDESYSLRTGTRLLNQAGMIFRLSDSAHVPPRSRVSATAVAEPIDQYGEVLGARGNVPANVRWEFPGLTQRERQLVYARNEMPATGGTTSYVNVLLKEDLFGSEKTPGAKQRLEQELLSVARQQVEEELTLMNALQGSSLVELRRDVLTRINFHSFDLPEDFIGQDIATVPVSGSLDYTVLLYDEKQLLSLLHEEVQKRVPQDKSLIESTIAPENIGISVLAPWDDDLEWIKITADLTYGQRYVLDPITKNGATFAKYIRDNVAGKSIEDAERIIKNLPEISRVEIRTWPPWVGRLPDIGTSIAITEKD